MEELIYCPGCENTKPISAFWKHKGRKNGVQSVCKVCHLEFNKKRDREKANAAVKRYYRTEKGGRHVKDYHLKRNFGITLEQYDQMFEEQGGVCAICDGIEKNRRLAVDHDHDHDTGRVRGLLCTKCNVKLEWAIEFDNRINDYLQEY